MKIVAVFHGPKVEDGMADKPVELRANPTLSIPGMVKIHELVGMVTDVGPYRALYSSRLARALDTASILALALDLDLQTVKGLGQHANKDSAGVCYYPGYEGESFVDWQRQAVDAVLGIQKRHALDDKVIIVSHRPSIGGLYAHALGIRGEQGIEETVSSATVTALPLMIFNVTGEEITVLA